MRLAKVVGNVVSTIRNTTHEGYKLMLVKYLDENLNTTGSPQIALDRDYSAGVGDVVLVNVDGAAAQMIFEDKTLIGDLAICGVINELNINKPD